MTKMIGTSCRRGAAECWSVSWRASCQADQNSCSEPGRVPLGAAIEADSGAGEHGKRQGDSNIKPARVKGHIHCLSPQISRGAITELNAGERREFVRVKFRRLVFRGRVP